MEINQKNSQLSILQLQKWLNDLKVNEILEGIKKESDEKIRTM